MQSLELGFRGNSMPTFFGFFILTRAAICSSVERSLKVVKLLNCESVKNLKL
jgi:hypothetical protein